MLAKTAAATDVRHLTGYDVIALIETAAGVVTPRRSPPEPNVVGLMWGAEDLVASLGGTSSRGPDGGYREVAVHARSTVLLAAGALGKAAIDAVHLDIDDLDGLAAEAADAAASGFAATACIHPSQVAVVRAAYRPSDDEVRWAREVLAAAVGQLRRVPLGRAAGRRPDPQARGARAEAGGGERRLTCSRRAVRP